ncbi:50S ribosomal protein L29 [Desulfosarcina sp. OttesenSCG-928-A07]|nr:50S ribosomal protein L29 [Desulfosarcina sp. OttesenSCG-928-G17]MDL2329202.1 50S ribosomal protein L29 [Desulfosarcina sp. OttesenSCG-928-A07]
MKTAEIRAMETTAIRQKIQDLKQTLFNLRFQHEIGQLDNPQKIRQTKKNIARLNTILNEESNPKPKD